MNFRHLLGCDTIVIMNENNDNELKLLSQWFKTNFINSLSRKLKKKNINPTISVSLDLPT